MSARNIVVRSVVVALLFGAGCTPRSGSAKDEATRAPTSNVTATHAVSELSKSDAERVATQWLNALRSRDRGQLEKLSAVPFELRELVQYPKCQPAEAAKPGDVVGAVNCLLEDKLLMEELAAQPAPVTEMVGTADLPAWAAPLQQSPPTNGKLVHIRLPGNGVSYQFVLLVTSSGVQRIWKFAEYDPD